MILKETNDYTKSYIMTSLFELMKEKNYEDITVTEIVKKAGVGRVTYYRNFESKDDIIRQYFKSETEDFLKKQIYKPRTKEDYFDIIKLTFTYFKKNQEFFKLIKKAHLETLYLEFLNENMKINFIENNLSNNKYLPYMYVGVIFNTSMKWLESDCKESIDSLSKTLFDFIFHNN